MVEKRAEPFLLRCLAACRTRLSTCDTAVRLCVRFGFLVFPMLTRSGSAAQADHETSRFPREESVCMPHGRARSQRVPGRADVVVADDAWPREVRPRPLRSSRSATTKAALFAGFPATMLPPREWRRRRGLSYFFAAQ
jgi:hypothetical protein